MIARALSLVLLSSLALTGCGLTRPNAVAKPRAGALAARAEAPVVAPLYRIALSEDGYNRLRREFAWKAETPRTVFEFDGFKPEAGSFRSQADPNAARLALNCQGDAVTWCVARPVERRTINRIGLPVTMTVERSWEARLDAASAAHLVSRTEDFFLWLEAGGEPLRQRAADLDTAWRQLSWAGADLYFPLGGENLPLYPSGMTRTHAQSVDIAPDHVGGGLRYTLRFDEARDATGRFIDTYAIEARPLTSLATDDFEPTAVDFSRALVSVGLIPDETAPGASDDAAFIAGQLGR